MALVEDKLYLTMVSLWIDNKKCTCICLLYVFLRGDPLKNLKVQT